MMEHSNKMNSYTLSLTDSIKNAFLMKSISWIYTIQNNLKSAEENNTHYESLKESEIMENETHKTISGTRQNPITIKDSILTTNKTPTHQRNQ